MDSRPKFFLTLIYEVKLKVNQVILWISIQLRLTRSIIIVPFNGYGNDHEFFLVGRVLKNNRVAKSLPEDSVWSNIMKMIRRFRTVVIPGVEIQASYQGQTYTTETNEEGYFEFAVKLEERLPPAEGWIEVSLTLMDQVLPKQQKIHAIGKIFIPSSDSEFGLISDIDDTIIPTGAMRLTEMLKTTFAKNAYSRLPFPGVSEVYQKLEMGSDGQQSNPFFYVSSSPWNLYDFLWELLSIHSIPEGPLMLRDIGLSRTELISGSHKAHKLEQIRKIFMAYPKLSFILVGDSGQEDAAIYLQICRSFPDRVLLVFIRDVSATRIAYVEAKAKEMRALGVEVKIGNSAEKATEILSQEGFISLE